MITQWPQTFEVDRTLLGVHVSSREQSARFAANCYRVGGGSAQTGLALSGSFDCRRKAKRYIRKKSKFSGRLIKEETIGSASEPKKEK